MRQEKYGNGTQGAYNSRLPQRDNPDASEAIVHRSTRLPDLPAPPPGAASTKTRPSLDKIVDQVQHLPALPHVVMSVMKLTGQSEYSTRQLADIIARDTGFAARILKLANSAYYGLPRSVGTINEAVVMLGNYSVRNLALVAATHDTMHQAVSGYELEPGDLWRHSMACAMVSEMLAAKVKFPEREEAFVAGLLHDVGKVILGIYVQDAIPLIRAHMEQEHCGFSEAEQAILGFDHAEVGGRVALHWNLPLSLAQAIAWHHEPVQANKVAPLAGLVHVANAICLMAGVGLGADGLQTTINEQALAMLNLSEAQVEDVIDRLVTCMAEAPSY